MSLSEARLLELRRLAIENRRLILRAIHRAKAGHLGGPLSCADMLIALYFEVLRIDPARPRWEERDRFVLSKGHSAIALYAAMALRGFFPVDELWTFDAIDSRLQGHPDMSLLPGLDMSTGSLGQGLSPGVGMALGARFLGKDFRTWVIVGDGDAQEGQIWEAAMVASRYELDNLTAIVDLNGLQQVGWATEAGYGAPARRPPLDDPAARFQAFGWQVLETDGHDMAAFIGACAEARQVRGRPGVIIAHTVKGKGVSFMEGDYTWHARPLTDEELARGLAELEAQEEAVAVPS